MFQNNDAENLDLIQVLVEHHIAGPDILRMKFTDILLIFDFDPQDPLYTKNKIITMQSYFQESTDMGKLYLNYPMVEAYYHMKTISDPDYINRFVPLECLYHKKYKSLVHMESKGHSYRNFITCREECDYVIQQNLEKARALSEDYNQYQFIGILKEQIKLLEGEQKINVLCTCCMFFYEYQPSLFV